MKFDRILSSIDKTFLFIQANPFLDSTFKFSTSIIGPLGVILDSFYAFHKEKNILKKIEVLLGDLREMNESQFKRWYETLTIQNNHTENELNNMISKAENLLRAEIVETRKETIKTNISVIKSHIQANEQHEETKKILKSMQTKILESIQQHANTSFQLLEFKAILDINEKKTTVIHDIFYKIKNISGKNQRFFTIHIFGDVPKKWPELKSHIYVKRDSKWSELYKGKKMPIFILESEVYYGFKIKFTPELAQDEESTIRMKYSWDYKIKDYIYENREDVQIVKFTLSFPKGEKHRLMVYHRDHYTKEENKSDLPLVPKTIRDKQMLEWQENHPPKLTHIVFKWT